MIRFYANQAGYLPKGRKIAVLAQEKRVDEMEKVQDKEVTLWNEKGEQTVVNRRYMQALMRVQKIKYGTLTFPILQRKEL